MFVSAEMPRYQCHKRVWALKIKSIEMRIDTTSSSESGPPSYSALITPEEAGYAPFEVSVEYVAKHKPEVGGYYVVYDDGYKSFSPAKAFEDGYTLMR